jgi:aspartate-semialdehyde dehydrogenase
LLNQKFIIPTKKGGIQEDLCVVLGITNKYTIAILGATGALGRELVKNAMTNGYISEVFVIVRRRLKEWDKYLENEGVNNGTKFNIIVKDSFDDLKDLEPKLVDCNAFYCCVGSRLKKVGEEEFWKVDFQYPMNFALLAKELSI